MTGDLHSVTGWIAPGITAGPTQRPVDGHNLNNHALLARALRASRRTKPDATDRSIGGLRSCRSHRCAGGISRNAAGYRGRSRPLPPMRMVVALRSPGLTLIPPDSWLGCLRVRSADSVSGA